MTQTQAAQNPVTPTTSTAETVADILKHRVYNLLILDESGSMASIKQATISGFNETLQTIQHAEREYAGQQHFVAVVPFSTCRPLDRFDLQTTAALKLLDDQTYKPNCGTPLYDAIGFGITQLSQVIGQQGGTYNVLVTVLTDGEENSSKQYTGPQIKTMIDTLRPLGWLFTYMGANHDVEKTAATLSIQHKMAFTADADGVQRSLKKDSLSRLKLYAKMNLSQKLGKTLTDKDTDYFGEGDVN
ncbi:vWA domain-containing protein [Spirosoma montaniterrae]|uniref:VWFA domain-containing protein n=1 Tax=Spirosoma montaniterrae TaxID=1178516 RepID=A0A1P9WRR9_9BACT|nr:vWA domain-containing protein [Spirosoma montaniterrae]AQG78075.1 hypothetical protein AWR27_01130 [Spirosoma montaniterrae]